MIKTGDVHLYESDTMSDAEEGGGAITARKIPTGVSNNLFEDISTLDRVVGRVNLRKLFSGQETQDQDKYLGSHIIISKIPIDNNVSINLFDTGDHFDRRPDASTRVENYRAKGANYNGFLWSTQWQGSRVLSIFQHESSPVPEIGDVLYLTGQNDTQSQYVKIKEYSDTVDTFTDQTGEFRKRILSITLSQPLEYDFIGIEIRRQDTVTPDATIKTTVVANAARYYSARPLAAEGQKGDFSVNVDSVYSQLIPSSLQEIAILDADASGTTLPVLSSGTGVVSFPFNADIKTNTVIYLGSPCLPDSLSIIFSGGEITDQGGRIKDGDTVIGDIDYSQGNLVFGQSIPTYTGSKTINFEPAGEPESIADTAIQAVTENNRGFVWNITLSPPPKPGSLKVSFLALGEWYDLYDDGSGKIAGLENGIGVGSINYASGTVSITTSALPDANSAIVYLWGREINYYNRAALAPNKIEHIWQTRAGIDSSTLVITWNDGTARTATATASGNITGDGTGTIDPASGELRFVPNTLPLKGSEFTVDYSYGSTLIQTFNSQALNNGNLELNLNASNIVPNSIKASWTTRNPQTKNMFGSTVFNAQPSTPNNKATDNGSGGLNGITGANIDYAAGTITFNPSVLKTFEHNNFNHVKTNNYSNIGIGV